MSSNTEQFRIFRDLNEGTRSVHLNWFGNGTTGSIAGGYLEAAKRVVEGADNDARHPDKYLWPVAFLLRHSVELSLKEAIEIGAEIHGEDLELCKPLGHDLRKLWTSTRKLLITTWPDGNVNDLVPIQEVVEDFHRVDPQGDGFRYATSIVGQKNLEKVPDVLSLSELLKQVEYAVDFLGGAICGFDFALQQKMEWEER